MKKKTRLFMVILIVILSLPINVVLGANVVEIVTCMKVDASSKEALGVSTEFLTTTPEVFVRLVLTGASPGEILQIAWYSPGEALWEVDNLVVTTETVYWASVEIDDTAAVTYDGIWKATIFHGVELEELVEKGSVNFKIVNYQKIITDFNNTLNYYADQISILEESITINEAQKETLAQTIYSLEAQVLALTGQITGLEANYTIVNSKLQSVQNDYNSLNNTYQEALSDLEEAQKKLEEAQEAQGPSTTLFYVAILAAALGILAAIYFAMKARS